MARAAAGAWAVAGCARSRGGGRARAGGPAQPRGPQAPPSTHQAQAAAQHRCGAVRTTTRTNIMRVRCRAHRRAWQHEADILTRVPQPGLLPVLRHVDQLARGEHGVHEVPAFGWRGGRGVSGATPRVKDEHGALTSWHAARKGFIKYLVVCLVGGWLVSGRIGLRVRLRRSAMAANAATAQGCSATRRGDAHARTAPRARAAAAPGLALDADARGRTERLGGQREQSLAQPQRHRRLVIQLLAHAQVARRHAPLEARLRKREVGGARVCNAPHAGGWMAVRRPGAGRRAARSAATGGTWKCAAEGRRAPPRPHTWTATCTQRFLPSNLSGCALAVPLTCISSLPQPSCGAGGGLRRAAVCGERKGAAAVSRALGGRWLAGPSLLPTRCAALVPAPAHASANLGLDLDHARVDAAEVARRRGVAVHGDLRAGGRRRAPAGAVAERAVRAQPVSPRQLCCNSSANAAARITARWVAARRSAARAPARGGARGGGSPPARPRRGSASRPAAGAATRQTPRLSAPRTTGAGPSRGRPGPAGAAARRRCWPARRPGRREPWSRACPACARREQRAASGASPGQGRGRG